MSKSSGETFIGFSSLLLCSALLCAPLLGWTGIGAALFAIYCCAHLVSGQSSSRR